MLAETGFHLHIILRTFAQSLCWLFWNCMKREITMTACIPGNPVRSASNLMEIEWSKNVVFLTTFCFVTCKSKTLKGKSILYMSHIVQYQPFFLEYGCLLPIFSQLLWSRFAETHVYLYTNVLTGLRMHYSSYFSSHPFIQFGEFRHRLSRSNKMK